MNSVRTGVETVEGGGWKDSVVERIDGAWAGRFGVAGPSLVLP